MVSFNQAARDPSAGREIRTEPFIWVEGEEWIEALENSLAPDRLRRRRRLPRPANRTASSCATRSPAPTTLPTYSFLRAGGPPSPRVVPARRLILPGRTGLRACCEGCLPSSPFHRRRERRAASARLAAPVRLCRRGHSRWPRCRTRLASPMLSPKLSSNRSGTTKSGSHPSAISTVAVTACISVPSVSIGRARAR